MSATRTVYSAALVLLVGWTIFCLIPGAGLSLAGQVWYVTLISHVALVLSLLPAWHASRIEEDD
jgi:hypothetical protein